MTTTDNLFLDAKVNISSLIINAVTEKILRFKLFNLVFFRYSSYPNYYSENLFKRNEIS